MKRNISSALLGMIFVVGIGAVVVVGHIVGCVCAFCEKPRRSFV